MMKKVRILSIVAIFCLLAVSCGKDAASYSRFAMHDVSFSDNGDKVILQYGSSLSKLIYQDGDVIKVNNADFTLQNQGSYWQAVAAASVDAVNSKFYMAYADNGSISSFDPSAGTYYFDLSSQVDGTGTNGIVLGGTTTDTNVTLAPACAIIRLNSNTNYDHVKIGFEANKIPKSGTLTVGNKSASISNPTFLDGVTVGGDGQFLYMEKCNDGWYVGVPIAGNSVTTTIYFEWETSAHVVTQYKTSAPVTLTKGHIYSVGTTRISAFDNNGAGIGIFMVSEGSAVRFSAGNLKCHMNSLTWSFAQNQYNAIGQTNASVFAAFTTSLDFDLFGWATSNYNAGQSQYAPRSKNTNNANYLVSTSIAGTNSDWGVYAATSGAPIHYGSVASSASWRTLTGDEWNYLLNNSTCGLAQITTGGNTYKGLIILPDYVDAIDGSGVQDWSTLTGGVTINTAKTSFSNNTYNATTWGTMENYGVIFLPVTGYRTGTTVYNHAETGYYWASTGGTYNDNAYVFEFGYDDEEEDYVVQRILKQHLTGCAVRLVTDFVESK